MKQTKRSPGALVTLAKEVRQLDSRSGSERLFLIT